MTLYGGELCWDRCENSIGELWSEQCAQMLLIGERTRVANCTFGTMDIVKLCVMYLYWKHTNNQSTGWCSLKNKLISLLSPPPPSYTVVTHLGTEMSWGVFVFPVKGRDREGGLSVLFRHRVFLSFSNFVVRQLVPPPPIFLKLHDSPA